MSIKRSTFLGVAGGTLLAAAVPFFASAQSSATSSAQSRPVPTVACIQAMAGLEDARIAGFDAMSAAHKSAMIAHSAALKSAASITDDAQRKTALQKAEQDFRTAMQAAKPSDAVAAAEKAVQTACGTSGRHMGLGFGGMMKPGFGMMGQGRGRGMGMMQGRGPNLDALAQQLGITADQLKTEMQGGKTIQQIAQEHGVTLPTGGFGSGWKNGKSTSSTSTSSL